MGFEVSDTLCAKAQSPEGGRDERRQDDERLKEKGDHVVRGLTVVFEAVDADE